MLTDDTLRKVRETARIDEVASGYLTLHRSGKDFVALCPFHDERHPSFRVSPARNIGKCFSCGEAADGSCATWRDAASRRQYAYWHANTISRWKRPLPLVVSGGGTSGKRCCWRTPRSLAACYRATP